MTSCLGIATLAGANSVSGRTESNDRAAEERNEMSDQMEVGRMASMNWQRAAFRGRPTQSIKDDDRESAGSKWLAALERKQYDDDDMQWGPWRRFEREFTSGWERTGVRRPR